MNSPSLPLVALFASLAVSSKQQSHHHIPQAQKQPRTLYEVSQDMHKSANSDKAQKFEEWPFGIYDYARDHQVDETDEASMLQAHIEAQKQKRRRIRAWAKDVAKYPAMEQLYETRLCEKEWQEMDPMIKLARATRAQYHPYNHAGTSVKTRYGPGHVVQK